MDLVEHALRGEVRSAALAGGFKTSADHDLTCGNVTDEEISPAILRSGRCALPSCHGGPRNLPADGHGDVTVVVTEVRGIARHYAVSPLPIADHRGGDPGGAAADALGHSGRDRLGQCAARSALCVR